MNDNEAMKFYTAIDFSDMVCVFGLTEMLKECVNMLNKRAYVFTEDEKDALGVLFLNTEVASEL